MKHTYNPPLDSPKRKKALENAKKRGEAATEWLKHNKLTKETQAEFNQLMRVRTKQTEL